MNIKLFSFVKWNKFFRNSIFIFIILIGNKNLKSEPRAVVDGLTVNLNLFLQGFYTGGGFMTPVQYNGGIPSAGPTDVDIVFIGAMNPLPPYNVIDEQSGVLQTDGTVNVTFGPDVISSQSYFLRLKHRNSVETWSSAPVTLPAVASYSFSSSPAQAFASNEATTVDALYGALFAGDLNQDGAIDGFDFLILDPSIQIGDGGYIIGDINGDGAVDGSDYLWMDPNVQIGAGIIKPFP